MTDLELIEKINSMREEIKKIVYRNFHGEQIVEFQNMIFEFANLHGVREKRRVKNWIIEKLKDKE